MTKQEFTTKISELIATTSEDMQADVLKLIQDNKIPFADHPDTYLLPKMVMFALCKKAVKGWEPLTSDYRAEANKLATII